MSRAGAGYHRLLRSYRERSVAIATVLLAIVVLNVADIGLTIVLVERGATELNPLVAALIDVGPGVAIAAKAALGVAIAGALWALRRYRRALEASLLVAGLLGIVVGYQVVGLLVA